MIRSTVAIDTSLTISPIRNGNGKIIGASKIACDISNKKQATQYHDLLLWEIYPRVKTLLTLAELAIGIKDRLSALSRAYEMTC